MTIYRERDDSLPERMTLLPRRDDSFTPKGFRPKAQGCRFGLPWDQAEVTELLSKVVYWKH